MSWKRLSLVLLLLLMLLQAAATEARSRRNNSHSRTRGNRRTQQQQHERLRTADSEFSGLPMSLAGDTAHTAVNGQPPPPPPPPAPPQHSRRQQHHASTATHRTQHHNRRRHHQGEGRHHHPHQQHRQQQYQQLEHDCPGCYQLEMRKKLRLLQIKDRVLTATGLMMPPNMTGVVMSSNPGVQGIIKTMRSPFPMPSDEPIDNQDEPDVKTEMLFFPVDPGNHYKPHPAPPSLRIPEGTDVLYFKLNHTVLGNRARRAILHVWLKPTHPRQSERERQVPASLLKASVSVFKVAKAKDPGGFIERKAVTTVMESYNPNVGNWVKIEVYQVLQEWLSRPEENLGLVVEATDSQGHQVAVTDPEEMPSHAPLLEIHTADANRSRSRRNSANFMCTNKNDSRCCRYPLTVDFVEMGWDFIVAPKVYEANFCNGECPFLYAHKYAHTALIQKLNSTNAQHGPCCGARKLSPMKMLYYDHDHKIKFDIIQDMVVERCGCS